MGFVKILVSLMILFVAVNLILTIYGLLNKKWREGLENASTTSTKLSTIPATHGTQATVSAKSAHKSKMHCPNGCGAPTGLSGNCNSLKKDADGNYYKSCPYECTGAGCQYDQQCSDCGAFKITGLWDKMGNYLGQNENVQKTAAGTIANDARVAGQPDGTLDPDTASAYTGAGGSISNKVTTTRKET